LVVYSTLRVCVLVGANYHITFQQYRPRSAVWSRSALFAFWQSITIFLIFFLIAKWIVYLNFSATSGLSSEMLKVKIFSFIVKNVWQFCYKCFLRLYHLTCMQNMNHFYNHWSWLVLLVLQLNFEILLSYPAIYHKWSCPAFNLDKSFIVLRRIFKQKQTE
jgi:hypothetical protein